MSLDLWGYGWRVAAEDYQTSDRPGAPEDGYSFHDLHALPGIYEQPEHYFFNDLGFGADEIVDQLHAAHHNPDHPVTVYRAVPSGVAGINTSDWVTPSKEYARQHADTNGGSVISAQVPARHLSLGGDSLYEFGYHGPHLHTAHRIAMPTWYHLTDDPDFQLDPSKVPTNLNYYNLGAGVFLTQRPEEWASSSASPAWPSEQEDDDEWNGNRPYVAEIDAPDDLHKLPGTKYAPVSPLPPDMPGSEEIFVPADQYHHLTVKNVRSRNSQPQTWKANLMTAAITVYTQPSCIQCTMTKKQLDKLGIDHDTVDVSTDPEAHAYVTGLGYTSAPVVVVGDGEDHWAGFKPDRLRGLVE